MIPPAPNVPSAAAMPEAGAKPVQNGSGLTHHEHHAHIAKQDRERFDKANERSLLYAIKALKLDDTPDSIVDRAKAFRAYLISTGTK